MTVNILNSFPNRGIKYGFFVLFFVFYCKVSIQMKNHMDPTTGTLSPFSPKGQLFLERKRTKPEATNSERKSGQRTAVRRELVRRSGQCAEVLLTAN